MCFLSFAYFFEQWTFFFLGVCVLFPENCPNGAGYGGKDAKRIPNLPEQQLRAYVRDKHIAPFKKGGGGVFGQKKKWCTHTANEGESCDLILARSFPQPASLVVHPVSNFIGCVRLNSGTSQTMRPAEQQATGLGWHFILNLSIAELRSWVGGRPTSLSDTTFNRPLSYHPQTAQPARTGVSEVQIAPFALSG